MRGSLKVKMKVKMGIDLLMTILLLLLMACQVTGESLHEWIGAGMLALFLLHNLLNMRWYGILAKGNYTLSRIVRTAVNFAVLAAMLIQAYSGIVLSRHVFAFLPVSRRLATARVMHLAGSYWGFILMSVHLGMHWGQITGMLRRLSGGKTSAALAWCLRLLFAGLAVYGAVCFCQADIVSYLFLSVEFAFLDYEKSGMLILAENFAMMELWVFLSYYMTRALGKVSAAVRGKYRRRRFLRSGKSGNRRSAGQMYEHERI